MSRVNTSGSEVAIKVANHNTTRFEQIFEKNLKWDPDNQKENFTTPNSNKILILCGPTATGKTGFGIKVAKKFDGEIISADSRQVYTGKNLIHGKDLPANIKYQQSNIKWRNRYLKFYVVDGVKVWLYDIVNPGEDFSVAYWKECADLVIADTLSRGKLPIIVGGTGLYIKSLTQNLSQITVPRNENLRNQLQNKSVKYLFNYLNSLDSIRATQMNLSDRQNPRRLIRAIEISLAKEELRPSLKLREGVGVSYCQIGLTTGRGKLYDLVNRRISDRISAGAASEDAGLADSPARWQGLEHGIVRHQLTWFKKQSGITWFDITRPGWQSQCIIKISLCLTAP